MKPPILSKWSSKLEGKRLIMGVNPETDMVSYRQANEDSTAWTDEECTLEEWLKYEQRATRLK
jgi:hypothetical protein